MGKLKIWLMAGVMLFGLVSALADALNPVRVRGAISGFDGHMLAIKTREGRDIKVNVADDTKVSSLFAIPMSQIKQGSFVGVTAIKKGLSGRMVALEVHLFPETSRGAGEGHRAWDLKPGSTMTNANIDAIVDGNDGKELTLSYKGGSQKIVMPPDTPVVSFEPGDKSLLKAGAQVFLMAQPAADGSLTAQRIQVGKDGMKPPM